MFYVYILKSLKDDKIYIGFTNNLRKRLKEHNQLKVFSTKGRGPFDLIYYEAYKNEKDAKLREKMIKHFGSAYAKLKLRLSNSLQ